MNINERLKTMMDRSVSAENGEAGAAAIIMKDGQELARYCCGYSDIEKGTPFTEHTICRAFSCSKVATGTAVMQLLERGIIELDSRLEWFIPEFSDAHYLRGGRKIKVSRPITIRDLLNMTSGIAYPAAPQDGMEGIEGMNAVWDELDKSYREGAQISTMEFAKKAGRCPLMFDTGAEWQYGASADILGAVVEAVSGKRFGDYMRENIFAPLGMENTDFYVPADKLDRLALFYEGTGKDRHLLEWVNLAIFDYTEDPAFQSGGAGLFTTASDYSKLAAALSNGEYNGTRILGRKTIDFMRQNALTPEQKKTFNWDSCRGYGYANLCRTLEDGNAASLIASKGSFGWDGWSGTYILNDPDERMSVVVFVQRAGAGTTSLAKAAVNAAYSCI